MTDFPKTYNFTESELKWRNFWEAKKIYESKPVPGKKKFSVVIPPPNVTGILHFGHILNNTIQDIYCRWKRMQGYEVCWVPGMDHAGIATQVVVEKDLAKTGKTKYDVGREKFIELCWKWKENHGGVIQEQLKKLGASVDWSKERFTLDEGLSLVVRRVFVDLFRKGLIYRGKRIVNWDPESQTAVSDDEIFYKEQKDKLYFIKYMVENSSDYLPVATTRPETMFGDTAVAVNPKDKRYKKHNNKRVMLPFLNKYIPVIEDSYVDIEFGTGALKITPAHDLNDFEVGMRHNLEAPVVLTKDSKLNENTGEFEGLGILEAREKIVEKLKEQGLLIKTEDYIHNVAVSDRTKAVIEPYLSEQWFVKMKDLSYPAIEVVKDSSIRFFPDKFKKVYFHWMDNIRDWCISRQLWWGHQIPIWYHKSNGEMYCDVYPPEDAENWIQDEDVLDTWFSSWLWPLSVFGWMDSEKEDKNEMLDYYYPTDLLSTGPEIIFLWVARMIMAGMEYKKEIPFRDVYFHSTIRDVSGVKMSKTLGNYSDAIELMNKYGTDALRFTMVYLAPLGNDLLFDEDKTQIGRNFITKLWNAGRFLYLTRSNLSASDKNSEYKKSDITDYWIESKFNTTLKQINRYLEDYRLNDYTKCLHSFVWSDFCDWYIEILKVKISNNPDNANSILNKAIFYYENILKLLHPVIPFVTEELWHLLDNKRSEDSISVQKIPEISEQKINEECESIFEFLKEVISGIRNLRVNNNVEPSKKCVVFIKSEDTGFQNLISENINYIERLCNLQSLIEGKTPDAGTQFSSMVINKFEIFLSLEGVLDKEKQEEMIKKEMENLLKYLNSLNKKLSNENFLSKASKEIVEKEKLKHTEVTEKLEKLQKLLD